MKRFSGLLLLLFCVAADAAETKLAPGTWRGQAIVTIVVDAAGNQTVTVDPSAPLTITGGGGVIPGPSPTPVPVPTTNLTDTVKVATAAIPAYTDRDTHRRAMAFGMSFISQTTQNVPVVDARKAVKEFCVSATGADAPKWSAWWATIDSKLDAMQLTPASYTAALGEISAALTSDLPASSEKLGETPTFGLPPEFVAFLMSILMPLLQSLIKKFFPIP